MRLFQPDETPQPVAFRSARSSTRFWLKAMLALKSSPYFSVRRIETLTATSTPRLRVEPTLRY